LSSNVQMLCYFISEVHPLLQGQREGGTLVKQSLGLKPQDEGMHIFRYEEASGAQLALTLFLGDLRWVLDKARIVLVVHADMTRWCLTQHIWGYNQRRCAAAPPLYRAKCWGACGGLPHHLPVLEVGSARAAAGFTCPWCMHTHAPAWKGEYLSPG